MRQDFTNRFLDPYGGSQLLGCVVHVLNCQDLVKQIILVAAHSLIFLLVAPSCRHELTGRARHLLLLIELYDALGRRELVIVEADAHSVVDATDLLRGGLRTRH